jgi:hypothetical protein
VNSIAVNGSDVYASGWFGSAGGITVNRIAKWNGSSWSALGDGLDNPALALAAIGNRLYAGGIFTNVASHIAVWNGSNWSALGSGVESWVDAIAISDTNIYVGGYFETAGDKLSVFFARWFSGGVCPSAIDPTRATLGVAATNVTAAVTAAGDCAWVAQSNDSWLHSSSSGSGSGMVSYSVDANTGSGFRTGTITIGEQTLMVHQAGVDSTPPTALCHDVTATVDATCHASVSASAVDNGSYDSDGAIVSRVLSPAGPYAKGDNNVTLTVTDNDGATDSCSATITVVDQTPPSLTCPANLVTNLPSGVRNAVVNFNTPVAGDNCETPPVVCTPASGSTFALGTNPVVCVATDNSDNTGSCTFHVILQSLPPAPHDLAVMTLKAPKKVTLKTGSIPKPGKLQVSIQNLGPTSEVIPSASVLANVVQVTIESPGACSPPALTLVTPSVFPVTLAPKKKLKLTYQVVIDCPNDPLPSSKTEDHSDYRYTVTVNRSALDGQPDTNPVNDGCPRAPSGTDKGCGGKYGAAVVTDVITK